MCVVAAAVPYIIAAVAAVGSTYVAVDSSNKQAKYQGQLAEVADKNAKLQQQNEANAGAQQEEAQRWKVRQLIGTQVAAFGANGIQSSTGTPLDILGETATTGEQDIQRIRDQAAAGSYGIQQNNWNTQTQNDLAQATKKNNNIASIIGGGSKVATASYGAYNAYQESKPPKNSKAA